MIWVKCDNWRDISDRLHDGRNSSSWKNRMVKSSWITQDQCCFWLVLALKRLTSKPSGPKFTSSAVDFSSVNAKEFCQLEIWLVCFAVSAVSTQLNFSYHEPSSAAQQIQYHWWTTQISTMPIQFHLHAFRIHCLLRIKKEPSISLRFHSKSCILVRLKWSEC